MMSPHNQELVCMCIVGLFAKKVNLDLTFCLIVFFTDKIPHHDDGDSGMGPSVSISTDGDSGMGPSRFAAGKSTMASEVSYSLLNTITLCSYLLNSLLHLRDLWTRSYRK